MGPLLLSQPSFPESLVSGINKEGEEINTY